MNNLLGLERMKLLKLIISDDEDSPPRYELPIFPEGYVMDEETAKDFLACNDRYGLKKLLAKLK